MNRDYLSFVACGTNYKISRESKKWNLYVIAPDRSNELVMSSWYPGDILNAATAIQNSNIPYLPPDDDTEDMPPRETTIVPPSFNDDFPEILPEEDFGSLSTGGLCAPSIWKIQAELKV